MSHGCILFLESLAEALRALDELVDAAHGAALLLGRELGRGEIIDAVLEATLDEVAVHLRWQVQQGIHRSMAEEEHTFMNCDICFFSMRMASSRCSLALRLCHGQRILWASAIRHDIPVHFVSVKKVEEL